MVPLPRQSDEEDDASGNVPVNRCVVPGKRRSIDVPEEQ